MWSLWLLLQSQYKMIPNLSQLAKLGSVCQLFVYFIKVIIKYNKITQKQLLTITNKVQLIPDQQYRDHQKHAIISQPLCSIQTMHFCLSLL